MKDWRRWTTLGLAFVCLAAELAEARPGGGQSYSGGSSGGGGGGSYGGGGSSGGGGDSGGGGELLELVFRLLWYLIASNPRVGIPVLLVLIGFGCLIYWGARRTSGPSWTTGSFGGQSISPLPGFAAQPSPAERLLALRAVDPDFSLVLFEDFAYALFAQAHTARGAGKLAELSAYLTPAARAGVAATSPPPVTAVRTIIVGAMALEDVRDDGQTVQAAVRFEANWTEVDGEGQEHGCYTVSVWRFTRARAARSKPPDKARVFACPNCAAPLTQVDKGVCASCGTRVDTGLFDWVVVSAVAELREDRGLQIGGDVPEQGTDLPTRLDRRLTQRLAELDRRDPSTIERFNARVETIFAELQAGWSNRDWTRVRPYLSDRLFQTQLGWIEEYQRQKLRNVTENARVTNREIAKVSSDRWYDAITVRLFATGLDYTVTDDGKLRSGSRSRERSYTEYWTLIRGTARPGGAPVAPADDKKCPNCGAELKVNMAGTCEYCNARVASGDFDWVLSRIEQDDSYQG